MSEPNQSLDPLASSRARDAQLAELKAQAQMVAASTAEGGTPRETDPEDRLVLERIVALGGHLMPLKSGIKKALLAEWQLAPALTVDEALVHLAAGGNVGIHLGFSGLIALDAENAAATQRVLGAEFQLTVAPAKSRIEGNPKHHGSHTWLRVPEGIDPTTLHTKLQVNVPGGGVMDVLAGSRYAVAPPSTLDEAPGWAYSAYAGSPLDLAVPLDEAVIATAPLWLFDPTLDCPAGLEPLRGALAPKAARDLFELDARSIELTAQIDGVAWADWLAADPRLTPAGEVDGCGCEVWHWAGSEHSKSVTLHEDCTQGSGGHIWSGTMQSQLGLGDHCSRLDLACALRGESRSRVAASVGIRLGGEQELDSFDAADLEELAAEAEAAAQAGGTTEGWPTAGTRLPDGSGVGKVIEVEVGPDGLLQRAAAFRTAAAGMRAMQHAVESQVGAVLIGAGSVVGAPTAGSAALALIEKSAPERPAPEAAPEQSVEAAPAVTGLPPVDPNMSAYRARAKEEVFSSPAPIDTNAGRAHGLLPVDTRSLADAVAGPRATASPVDVEATDGQLAQAVAAAVAGKLRYVFDAETWYAWDGDRFAVDAEAARGAVQGLLQRQGQATDPAERQRMIRAWAWKKLTAEQKLRAAKEWEGFSIDMDTGDLLGPDGVRIEQVAAEVPAKAEETRTRNAVVAQLGSDRGIKTRTAQLDAHPEVVACEGGYMHLATPTEVAAGAAPVTVTTPDPAKLATKLMGARYVAGAQCPRWVKLLEDALPNREVRRWLQKALGQALFGRQDEHLLLVLEGQGGNGKGTVMEVITAVFGEYAAVLQASVLTLAGMGNHATDQMPLRGARLATADEIPPQQLNLDLVKKLTGGGPHSARLCGQNSTTWELSHTMCLTTNNRLQWPPSAMAAVRRRLAVIRFEVAFGEAGFPPIVKGLAASIISGESSGVLNWLADGYRMYTEESLETYQDLPPAILEWTQATLAQSSSWAGFCDVAFEVTKDPSDVLLSGDIFKLWDYYRSEDTDQKHASPGSVRVVAAMVVDQLRGVTRIEARGKVKAGVRGVRWSEDGLALLEEMHAARFATPVFGPSVTPLVPSGM